mgnify:CR=1 FL=1
MEELLQIRGVEVDHSTIQRWVFKFSPEVEKNMHKRKRQVCSSWRMDETYIKVKGKWAYLYRALDKLVELGKVHKIESRNAFIACQNSSCQISKATAFSICESCENVSEISNSKLSKYLSNFTDDSGMKYNKYNLEFFGLCKKCKSI